MWTYDKMLEYPVNIKCKDPRLAKVIISQYGGPDGELAASLRYLSQRFGMPDQKSKAILNDVRNWRISTIKIAVKIKKLSNFRKNVVFKFSICYNYIMDYYKNKLRRG